MIGGLPPLRVQLQPVALPLHVPVPPSADQLPNAVLAGEVSEPLADTVASSGEVMLLIA